MALWDLDDFDTEELVELFADLSFVKFDAKTQTIHPHDVVREVLETKLQEMQSLADAHRQLIDHYGDLTNLPDEYAWRNIAYHLKHADRLDTLHDLLLTFNYLQNKLNATDPNALIVDCDYLFGNKTIQIVQPAINMSLNITKKSQIDLWNI